MLDKIVRYSEFLKKYPSQLFLSGIFILSPLKAQALTADDVSSQMSSEEQTAYVSGYVGGIAYGKWLKTRPDKTAMNCVYNWFHGENNSAAWSQIDRMFGQYPDKPIEPLLYALIKKECGE